MKLVVTTRAISHAKLQSNQHQQQLNTLFFTGRMPFLSPNQQCQSTEGWSTEEWGLTWNDLWKTGQLNKSGKLMLLIILERFIKNCFTLWKQLKVLQVLFIWSHIFVLLISCSAVYHCESKKEDNLHLPAHNFAKCWSTFKILSPTVVIWRRNRFWNWVSGCWNRVTRIRF